MKLSIILLLLLLLAGNVQAQPIYRLRAIGIDEYIWGEFRSFDSATFSYEGNRPGNAGWEWAATITPWAYDAWATTPALQWSDAKRYSHDPNSAALAGIYIQEYNSNGDIASYTENEYNVHNYKWETRANHFVYDNNKLKEKYENGNRYRYHYTSTGMVDSISRYEYTGTSPAWSYRDFVYYGYNSNGQVVEKYEHYYGGSHTQTSYTYDTNGKLLNEFITGTKLSPDTSIIDYTYDTGGKLLNKLLRQTDYFSAAVINYEYDTLIYDATGGLQERIYQRWDVDSSKWVNYKKDSYTNNSFGLPANFDRQHWKNGVWTYGYDVANPSNSCYRMRYYYELAWPLSVADAQNNMEVLTLYPSPASGSISMHVEWQDVRPFTAAMYDMQGKVVKQWQEAGAKIYQRSISLEGIPAGQYVIKALGDKQQVSKQFAIIK